MKKLNLEMFYFKDGGKIPNSDLPLLAYRQVTTRSGPDAADWMEGIFARNDWRNSWRWGIHPYHHYHSNTHEVLGVFSGQAILMMGGVKGKELRVGPGDVLIIPAGVAHRCLYYSNDFCVIGAYPSGLKPDLHRGLPGERPMADLQLAKVRFPETDPLLGRAGGLCLSWKAPISGLLNPL